MVHCDCAHVKVESLFEFHTQFHRVDCTLVPQVDSLNTWVLEVDRGSLPRLQYYCTSYQQQSPGRLAVVSNDNIITVCTYIDIRLCTYVVHIRMYA